MPVQESEQRYLELKICLRPLEEAATTGHVLLAYGLFAAPLRST